MLDGFGGSVLIEMVAEIFPALLACSAAVHLSVSNGSVKSSDDRRRSEENMQLSSTRFHKGIT